MTYKVRVRPRDVEIEFETGSIGEAVGILESEKNAIGALFAAAPWAGDQAATLEPVASGATAETPAKAKPGRKPRNAPDPASASAPPPVPVAPPTPPAPPAPPPMPPAAVPPTAPAAGNVEGIPPFLKREAPPAPPAPPVPAAPPVPPVISKRLGGLVKAELEKRAGSDATAKAQLTDWLVKSGMILEGSEFNEALAVVSVETDENLREVAAALGIQ